MKWEKSIFVTLYLSRRYEILIDSLIKASHYPFSNFEGERTLFFTVSFFNCYNARSIEIIQYSLIMNMYFHYIGLRLKNTIIDDFMSILMSIYYLNNSLLYISQTSKLQCCKTDTRREIIETVNFLLFYYLSL